MRSRSKKSVVALTLALGLAISGPALAAHADAWNYPGNAYCSPNTVATGSYTTGGTTVQHRVTGYGGDYYASWAGGGSGFVYHQKNWGFYSAWNARVGVTGSGSVSASSSIFCV